MEYPGEESSAYRPTAIIANKSQQRAAVALDQKSEGEGVTVFLNSNVAGWDSMGRTMSLPNDGEYRHKVLDLVAVGDEVITMDSDHLRLYSIVNKAAYDDTRMRDGKPVDRKSTRLNSSH